MYTISGCQVSMRGYRSNLGATTEDIKYSDLVNYLWNKFKGKTLVPGILGVPNISLSKIIPDSLEPVVTTMFIQETEKIIKKASDIDNNATVGNLCKSLSKFAIDKLHNEVVSILGAADAESIFRTTLSQALGITEGGVGAFDIALDPFAIAFCCLSEGGPVGPVVRNTIITEIAGELQKELVRAIKELTGYEPPAAVVAESEQAIFGANATAKAKELANTIVTKTTIEAVWENLSAQLHNWCTQNRPGYSDNLTPQAWMGTIGVYISVLAVEVKKVIAERSAEAAGTPAPQHIAKFTPKIEPKIAKKGAMVSFFSPVGKGGATTIGGISIIPLAIGGVALLFLLKKKK